MSEKNKPITITEFKCRMVEQFKPIAEGLDNGIHGLLNEMLVKNGKEPITMHFGSFDYTPQRRNKEVES